MAAVRKYALTVTRDSLADLPPTSSAVDLSLADAVYDESIQSAFVPEDGLSVFMALPIACRFDASGNVVFNVYASEDMNGTRYRVRLWDGPAIIGTVFVEMPRSDTNLASLIAGEDSGGVPQPAVVGATILFGTSADVPTAAELTVEGVDGSGTIEGYAGDMRVLIAKLDSEGALVSVTRSDDVSNTNQLGAFTKFESLIDVRGEDYGVWISNQLLTQPLDVIWSAA